MEDVTPLNLEDQPKLFGLRFDQLTVVLVTLILASQLYSWLSPIPFWGGQDLRTDMAIFIFLLGPLYCLITANNTAAHWETLLSYYMTPQIYVPGPDHNPVRFLMDETLADFIE